MQWNTLKPIKSRVHECIRVWVYAEREKCECASGYVCIYVHTYIYIYVYTHTEKDNQDILLKQKSEFSE